MVKVAFITAIYGGYEYSCKDYIPQGLEAEFICFTDTPNIVANNWNIDTEAYHITHASPLDDGTGVNSLKRNRTPFNIAKYYKEQWHRIPRLAAYDYVIWLDGTIQVISPDFAEYIVGLGEQVVTLDHDWRWGRLENEVLSSLPPYSERYKGQDVAGQYAAYLRDGYDESVWKTIGKPHYGVFVTCFVAWKRDGAQKILDLWYEQNLKFTTQDQVAFPYVCWRLGVRPHSFPDAWSGGNQFHNRGFTKLGHGL